MSWIEMIDYDHADGRLKKVYDRVKGPNNNVDNILQIHSLRPHSLLGHMALYKNVLHNSNNTLPKWYLEAIGVYVSYLNECSYCVEHHFAGFERLLGDVDKAATFMDAVKADSLVTFFDAKFALGAAYARKLTLDHKNLQKEDVQILKVEGFTDGEVLELNQVVSYFNYVNRTVLGLGVTTTGDILGLSPNDSDDPDNWQHT